MNKWYIAIIVTCMASMTAPAIAGDAAAGETAYQSKGCVGCHGNRGHSIIPANPVLAGKEADYLKQQLTAFKSGERQNPTMNAMVGLLNEADIENIATYLSEQE